MSSELIQVAKQNVSRWFDRVHFGDTSKETASVRRRLMNGVEIVFSELPNRNSWLEVMTRRYVVEGLEPGIVEDTLGAAYIDDNHLTVTTIVPGWAYGWRKILKDEYVYDTLSWFLHYARQYIHRSWISGLLMAVYESSENVLHPFAETISSTQRYSDFQRYPGKEKAIQYAWHDLGCTTPMPKSSLSSSVWLRVNTLDPYLHQCIANCLRGFKLEQDGHSLESVVASDCVIQSCALFLQSRNLLSEGSTRKVVCEALGLGEQLQYSAEFAYFIRNNFGAHPRGWRCWDVGELLDARYDGSSELALAATKELSRIEENNRRVQMEVNDWTEWLLMNFSIVFDAVWFDAIAAWDLEHPDPSSDPEDY